MSVDDSIDVSTDQDDGLKQAHDQSCQSNESETSAGLSNGQLLHRFSNFDEYCRTFFENCKAMSGSMSKEECDQVEERLEMLEEELRSVIKEVRRVGKAKRS